MLTCQILSQFVHYVGFRWPKTTISGTFGHLGILYRPLLPMRAKFSAVERTHGVLAKFRLDRFLLSPSGGEKPQFLPFFGLRHLVVSPIGENVEHGCTTTNLSLSNGIKSVSGLQRLLGEIRRPNSNVQKRDGQTRQKTSTFLAAPAAGEIRTPPNLAW